MKKIVLIFTALILISSSYSQSNLTSVGANIFEKTPSSPTAAGLSKYLEYPVNMSSGIPSIEIPIYTISEGNIKVPISLQFYAGGIKVNDLPGPVGLGWSLKAGGAVVKKVNGLDDLHPETINHNSYINPNYSGLHPTYQKIEDATDRIRGVVPFPLDMNDAAFMERFVGRIIQSRVDGEADEFMFSTPEGAGKIYFNQRQNQWQINKRNGWKVEAEMANTYELNNFSVYSNNGIKYKFGTVEMITNPLLLAANAGSGVPPSCNYLPSSWHLSNIVDAANNREVTLSYYKPIKTVHGGDEYIATFQMNGGFYGLGSSSSTRIGEEAVLDKIFFTNGRIEFIPTSTPGSLIKEIKIYNQNRLCKMYKLTYIYKTPLGVNGIPDPLAQIPFLDSFEEVDISTSGNLTIIPPYKFSYDFSSPMPKRDSYAQDVWGFYNGKLSNPNLVPKNIVEAYNPSWADNAGDREIDVNYCNVGNIKEIIYPTGGKTNFEFEINKEDGGLIGGVRIKNVINYDPVSNSNITTAYDYKDANEVESGVMLFRPRLSYDMVESFSGPAEVTVVKIMGNSIYPLFPNSGSPVYYQHVTKKLVSNTQNLVSKHYFSIATTDGAPGANDGVPFNKFWIDENSGGLELKNEIFKTLPNNTLEKISSEETSYGTLNNYNEKIWNIQAAWAKMDKWTTWAGNDPYVWNYPQMNMDVRKNLYPLIRESVVPMERTKKIFSNGEVQNDNTIYTYDNTTGVVRSVKTFKSNGDITIRKIKYSSNYTVINSSTNSWNNSIKTLADINSIVPIEEATYLQKQNSTTLSLIDATLYEYGPVKIKKIYKLFTNTPINDFQESYNNAGGFYFDNRYKLVQEVMQSDAFNNPVSIQSDLKIESYIRGHNSTSIIAFVSNAPYTDIAYTSFDAEESGNWSYTGLPLLTQTVTGKYAYNLSNGAITKAALDITKTYVVSYWSKNGAYSITGSTSVITGKTLNGWTYYEHKVSNANNLTITGLGLIDELRVYPQNALMTTYTYEPLVGITTQCDQNNKITYYEYDIFNRLSLVRDQDNNVLKKICYNYAGQPENCLTPCPPNSQPIWQNTGNTRCQVNSYGVNTGIEEIEQQNTNPCNTATTQWVSNGTNTNTCPIPSYVSLTSTNTYGTTGYIAKYTPIPFLGTPGNGTPYYFNVPATTGLQSLGSVPAGTYTVEIYRTTIPMLAIFRGGCWKPVVTGTSATFNNINVTTCNSISITLEAQ